jgi:hypothetical protein
MGAPPPGVADTSGTLSCTHTYVPPLSCTRLHTARLLYTEWVLYHISTYTYACTYACTQTEQCRYSSSAYPACEYGRGAPLAPRWWAPSSPYTHACVPCIPRSRVDRVRRLKQCRAPSPHTHARTPSAYRLKQCRAPSPHTHARTPSASIPSEAVQGALVAHLARHARRGPRPLPAHQYVALPHVPHLRQCHSTHAPHVHTHRTFVSDIPHAPHVRQ